MEHKIKILVVDKDKENRLFLKEHLEKKEYCIEESENGAMALEILSKGGFNIVIAEFNLPEMDGIELLSKIKKINQPIEVVFISSNRDIDEAIESMRGGAYDFITKPFDIEKVLKRIDRLAEKCFLAAESPEITERRAFFKVTQALISTIDLKGLLELIMESIQKVIQADQGSIMLLDKKKNELALKTSFGLKDILEKKNDKSQLKDPRQGPAWKVIEQGKPTIIISGLENYSLFKDIKSHNRIKSSMIVPLKIKDQTRGVINLARTKIETEFNQRDLSIVTIFAGQAAAAIENVFLYKKLEDYSKIIKQEKEEIEAIVENISDGIVVCNPSDKIILFNQSFKNLFKLDSNSIVNNSCSNIFKKEKFREISDFIQNFKDSNNDFVEKKFNASINGENIHLRVTIAKIKESKNIKGNKILAFEDLTKLVQTQKVAAWQGMARSLAHEVKNPLTPILWAAEAILEKKSVFSEPRSKIVENKCAIIIKEVKRLHKLISEFSTFAKQPEPNLKSEDIRKILQQVLLLYSSVQNIKITTKFPEDFPLLKVDSNMIKQVFINLIKNAIDAMPDGGELLIEGNVSSNVASLSFTDTGKGIPHKMMAHLFDPYYTTKDNGTGLGLTISSKIISDHSGQIRVKSKENQGATFIINLPSS